MGAFKYTKASCGLALVICTLLINQSSSYVYTMEQMCAQWWDSGYVGNPTNCKGWGYCQGQKLVSWGVCGNGLVFNAQTGTCSDASNTICSTSVKDTCSAFTSPVFLANPDNCTEYGYCYGNGTFDFGSCPQGQVYQASIKQCVYASTCPQDSLCRFMKSDIFIGDINNCGQFVQCLNGEAKPGTCSGATNKYYNKATGLCEATSSCDGYEIDPDATFPPNATVCENGYKSKMTREGAATTDVTTDVTTAATTAATTADPSGTTAATTADPSGTTAASSGTTAADGSGTTASPSTTQFFADGQTCYGYYTCTSTSGPGTWAACPKGSHFDESKQQCVSPAAFACTKNRCGNLNLQFVTLLGSGCKKYTVCASNSTGECQSPYPYFNEVTGYCEQSDPKYAVCTS